MLFCCNNKIHTCTYIVCHYFIANTELEEDVFWSSLSPYSHKYTLHAEQTMWVRWWYSVRSIIWTSLLLQHTTQSRATGECSGRWCNSGFNCASSDTILGWPARLFPRNVPISTSANSIWKARRSLPGPSGSCSYPCSHHYLCHPVLCSHLQIHSCLQSTNT